MTQVLAPFPDMLPMALQLAPLIGARIVPIGWRHFPDGESLITLSGDVTDCDLAVLCTLRDPDRHMLPLRFAAATARELGAASTGLIAPYLAYMRQDRRFSAGQAVSAPLFAACLAESFDWLATADPHLHRIPDLDSLYSIPARRVETAPALAEWITRSVADPILTGPDEESRQWVARVAAQAGCDFEVLGKHRSGDRCVEISPPAAAALSAGTPVILDDIASSGRTMVKTIERLRQAGASPPVCIVIHAVFAEGALADIQAAGARRIISTDSIPHETNGIRIAPLLADAVRRLSGGRKMARNVRKTQADRD